MIDQKKETGAKPERDMIKEYAAIRQKYSLPELNELDKEFCIGTIEPTNFILRSVLDKMKERIEQALKILGDLIQPESHIADMHEAEAFTDEEKKGIYNLFRRFLVYHKEFLIHNFDYSDEAAAQLISKFLKDWKIMKSDFIRVLLKTKEAWGKEIGPKEEFGYFG